MPATLKAVVIKIPQLKSTRQFFEDVLKLSIVESSIKHFVIRTKGIRLVFIASAGNLEVELYVLNGTKTPTKEQGLEVHQAPSGMRVIIERSSGPDAGNADSCQDNIFTQ